MANPIDESNLLIYNPKTASVIFAAGSGIISKSTKIMSSITQALLLFSDKVVNQTINYIRFHQHRLVFVKESRDNQEDELVALKLVPKDQLPKDYLPAMKVPLTIINTIRNDLSILKSTKNQIKTFYSLLIEPKNVLYVFPKTVLGYKAALVYLAALNFDLSVNLNLIRENIVFYNPEAPKPLDIHKKTGMIIFDKDVSYNNIGEISKINLATDFNFVFERVGNVIDVSSFICFLFGSESNVNRIKEIIYSDENIDDIITTIIRVDSETGVDIAIQSISNYVRDQKIAKSLYQIVLDKLKELDESEPKQVQSDFQVQTTKSESQIKEPEVIQKEPEPEKIAVSQPMEAKVETPVTPEPPVEPVREPEQEISGSPREQEKPAPSFAGLVSDSNLEQETKPSQPVMEEVSTPLSNFSDLASEFTTKMKEIYEKDEEEESVSLNISNSMSPDEISNLNFESEINELPINSQQIMMDTVNIYINLKPFLSGSKEFDKNLKYRPSLQIAHGENSVIKFEINVHPLRNDEFNESLASYLDPNLATLEGQDLGKFLVSAPVSNLTEVLRVILWLMLIDYSYNVQKNLLTPTDFYNIKSGSICIIPGGVTPERKKQLPSQISEVIEEEKLIKGEGIGDIINTLDTILERINSKLKVGKSIGFVPRQTSKEIPLIFEFILVLSELTGIGWSRW